jgi:hypothetical protein
MLLGIADRIAQRLNGGHIEFTAHEGRFLERIAKRLLEAAVRDLGAASRSVGSGNEQEKWSLGVANALLAVRKVIEAEVFARDGKSPASGSDDG